MTRNELLSNILHGVGLPLIESIICVSVQKPEVEIEAQLSTLLNMVVESSEEIRENLDITNADAEDLQLRTNLLSFSSKIVSIHYREQKNIPTRNELKTSVSSISVLQAFSDEYLPPESLTMIYPENDEVSTPSKQMIHKVSYIECFIPLVNAIGTFSFGMTHTKMMQDVSGRLRKRASDITAHSIEATSPVSEKRETELSMLKALINIYVSCHEQETQRIMALTPDALAQEQNEQQIENIWSLFEQRITILFTLLDNVLPPQDTVDLFDDDDFSDVDFEAHVYEPESDTSPLSFYRKDSDES